MDVVTIGRSSANDFVIQDPHASRHHCQLIRHDNGSFELVDISSYGTYVNGRKVNKRIYLHKGDIVKVGNTCIPWMSYFGQSTMVPTYETEDTPVVSYPYQNPPVTPIVTPPIASAITRINIRTFAPFVNLNLFTPILILLIYCISFLRYRDNHYSVAFLLLLLLFSAWLRFYFREQL